MAAFDPYFQWLAIPPEEQPPHHYRLLGLPIFLDDLDVIEGAAEQRTIYLRTFQTGPNSAVAERLLNEVSAARICLLTAAEKAEYDRTLKALVETKASTSIATGGQESQRTGTGKKGWKEPWVLATAAGAIAVILFWVLMNSGNEKANLADTSDGEPSGLGRQIQDPPLQKPKEPVPENGRIPLATKDSEAAAARQESAAEEEPVDGPDRTTPTLPEKKPGPDEEVAVQGSSAAGLEAPANIERLEDYVALYVLVAPKAKEGINYNVIATQAELAEWRNRVGGVTRGERLGYVRLKPQAGLVPLYRVRTSGRGRYLFRTEPLAVKSQAIEWRQKVLGWVAPRDAVEVSKVMAPIYGLTHPKTGQRRFTSNLTVRDTLLKQGWLQDRILAYAFRATPAGKGAAKKQ